VQAYGLVGEQIRHHCRGDRGKRRVIVDRIVDRVVQALDSSGEQPRLVGEVGVHRALARAASACDGVDAGGSVPVGEKQLDRRVENQAPAFGSIGIGNASSGRGHSLMILSRIIKPNRRRGRELWV
jgi:hypothetical protein